MADRETRTRDLLANERTFLAWLRTAATVMVLLGLWQLDRYHQRTDINNRIDAGAVATPLATPSRSVSATPSPAIA